MMHETLWLALWSGCVSASDWRPAPAPKLALEPEADPSPVALDELSVAGWLGPEAGSRFGRTATVYGDRSHLAILAPRGDGTDAELFLLGKRDRPFNGLGDLEADAITLTGEASWCLGAASGFNLGALETEGRVEAFVVGCYDTPGGGRVYVLPADAIDRDPSGPPNQVEALAGVIWRGSSERPWLGSRLDVGDPLSELGQVLVVAAPGPNPPRTDAPPGAVYLLPTSHEPGEYSVEGALTTISGGSVGDYLGWGLELGAERLAISALGSRAVYLIPRSELHEGKIDISGVAPFHRFEEGNEPGPQLRLADLDDDGHEDLVMGAAGGWYGVLSPDGALAASGSCRGATWCLERAVTAFDQVEVGTFDREGGPDLALSSAPYDAEGYVMLFYDAGRLAGPLSTDDIALFLTGHGHATGSALAAVDRGDYDWLLIGQSGWTFGGTRDLGAVSLVDLSLAP